MKRINDADIYNIHTFSCDTKNREIYLHSSYDYQEEYGVEYKAATTFEKNIRYLNILSSEPILVHMHLPGGDWEDCMGMYDAIQNSKSKITILAYAKIQSASSVVFQAAHNRILMPNSHVLIHYGSISLDSEHSTAAASSLKWNEKECQKMIDIFTDRCIAGPIAVEKNWKRMMARKHIVAQITHQLDWILTAQEAVYYGFADDVLGSKKYPTIDSLKK
jgi:ATP-dependent protease ClpP protease subunit